MERTARKIFRRGKKHAYQRGEVRTMIRDKAKSTYYPSVNLVTLSRKCTKAFLFLFSVVKVGD